MTAMGLYGIDSFEKRSRSFRTKGFLQIFDGFLLKTKGFSSKAYKIFRELNASRMAVCSSGFSG